MELTNTKLIAGIFILLVLVGVAYFIAQDSPYEWCNQIYLG